jgi:hypothetical protein
VVCGDTQLISARERDRRPSALSGTRRLALVALDDRRSKKRTFGLDGRIAMSNQYDTTMLWSRALRRWFPADGFRYASRHAGTAFPNVRVFGDRCRAALTVELHGRLAAEALRRCGFWYWTRRIFTA